VYNLNYTPKTLGVRSLKKGCGDKEMFDDGIETARGNHFEPRSGYQTLPWVYSANKNEYYVKLVR
jgi:hypothetical protein